MGFDKNTLASRIKELMYEFVKVKSDTNTKYDECIEGFFKRWLECIPYFKTNTDYCGFHPASDECRVPWALVKGHGNETVVLIHHCDTVDTNIYSKVLRCFDSSKDFSNLAYNPDGITEAFKHIFKKNNEDLNDEIMGAKKDFYDKPGDWLFGRGVADMKGGGAIHMTLLEMYAKSALDGNFKGNVLLLSLPDEENLSVGMIGATKLLKRLKEDLNLEYVLTVDAESHEREDDSCMIIHDGSIGKVMPVVYVKGEEAHSGMIYKGLNPINLLAEIIRQTELSPAFIEKFGNSVSPPPTWLYHKDCKNDYDVTSPGASLGYMSVLTLSKTPKEIMEILRCISEDAFRKVIKDMVDSYTHWIAMGGKPSEQMSWKPNVKMFSELIDEMEQDDKNKIEGYKNAIKENKKNDCIIDLIKEFIEAVLKHSKDKSPVVVLALSPPYYPAVNNSRLKKPIVTKMDRLLGEALEQMKDYGVNCRIKNTYTGISDLSYSMCTLDDEEIEYIRNNMKFWADAKEYFIPFETIKDIATPVLNIGPWGKNIHKCTERVYLPDLYYRTPQLTDFVIRRVLLHYS